MREWTPAELRMWERAHEAHERVRSKWVGCVGVGYLRTERKRGCIIIEAHCDQCSLRAQQPSDGREWTLDLLVRRLVTEDCERPKECRTRELLVSRVTEEGELPEDVRHRVQWARDDVGIERGLQVGPIRVTDEGADPLTGELRIKVACLTCSQIMERSVSTNREVQGMLWEIAGWAWPEHPPEDEALLPMKRCRLKGMCVFGEKRWL